MAYKFKVGDKVKYIKALAPVIEGSLGVVVDTYGNDYMEVDFDNGQNGYKTNQNNIELVESAKPAPKVKPKPKFKVGDKVVLAAITPGTYVDHSFLGAVGVISSITGQDLLPYKVDFKAPGGEDWGVAEKDLKLLEPTVIDLPTVEKKVHADKKHVYDIGDRVLFVTDHYGGVTTGTVGTIISFYGPDSALHVGKGFGEPNLTLPAPYWVKVPGVDKPMLPLAADLTPFADNGWEIVRDEIKKMYNEARLSKEAAMAYDVIAEVLKRAFGILTK
jgi:hypothetical protein